MDNRVPLSDCVNRNKYDGTPAIVFESIKWINENAMEEPGLFKTPGNQSEIANLKQLYDDGLFHSK